MYANKELCEKWNNNIPLSELESEEYILVQYDYDIRDMCKSFGLDEGEITGIVVTVLDGDYGEVYVTESSRPYNLSAVYHPLEYYK